MQSNKIAVSIKKSSKGLASSFPAIFAIILLIGIINNLLSEDLINNVFSDSGYLNTVIGSVFGSVLAGSPITSYIISGELLKNGVGLMAVTSFIVAWVSVGLIQLPAEAELLGKKFAITRNAVAFIFSIVVAVIICLIVGNS